MQRTSESLRLGIPEIVRNATRADMRECTRYDVDMTAQRRGEWAQLQGAHPRYQ